jgi:ABC-2 type transport system permease protein
MIINKAIAFIRRDFQIETSYRLNFMMMAINSTLPLVLFFFISKIIDPEAESLEKYGGNYFAFVIVGLAFYQYFQRALSSYSRQIQRDQVTGCLEAMLGTQTAPHISILLSTLYSMIFATFQLFIVFLGGYVFFGFRLTQINLVSTSVVFFLSLCVFLSFGLLSSASIILFKKGDPLGWLVMNTNMVVGGAFFPVGVMPEWLQKFAFVVPAKYSLDALRLTMIQGYDLLAVSRQSIILALMALFLIPCSIKLLLLAVQKAKKDGTLVQY